MERRVFPHQRACVPRRPDDRGDTLVEVLVAVVIIGLAVVAMMGAILTTTTTSVDHQATATIDSALASFAEAAENTVELAAYNGAGTGPAFTTACPATYQIFGSPMPARGPVGTQIAVMGTPSSLTTLGSATFDGVTDTATDTPGSTTGGAISLMTVPDEPAGSYQITPFDSTHQAAATFTVTPSVGSMSPAGATTGAGSPVSASVKGFAANSTLTVTIGSTQLTSGYTGNTTDRNGTATFDFTIPSPLPPGDSSAQYVTISDGTNISDPTILNFGTDTSSATPVATSSPFDNGYYTFNSSVSYWNGSTWTSSCPGTNSNIQELTFTMADSQPGNGASGTQTILVSNFGPSAGAAPPPNFTVATPSGSTGQLDLSWDTPTYTGSSSVTSYSLYRSTTNSMPSSPAVTGISSSATSYSDTGLSTGEGYYYWLTAVTSSGSSQPSTSSGTTLPGSPTSLVATRGDAQVTLSWSGPSPNGDAPITKYNIYRSTTATMPSTATTSVSGTSYTDTGLTNGTTYYYWVTAVNGGGEGSAASASATPATIPSSPQNLSVTPDDIPDELVVTWSAPSSNGGLPISSYTLYRNTVNSEPAVAYRSGLTATTFTDLGLTAGTTYYYWVTAFNAVGESPAAGPASYEAGAPGPPQSLSATASTKCTNKGKPVCDVALAWSAPLASGGSPVIQYDVYRSTSNTMPNTTIANGVTTTSYTDSKVAAGTTYYYWVTAVSITGYQGSAAGPASATPS